ncbi:MAG: 4Fe-4S binding protein [Deltaproteobacteria bacterium]|jgi:adenylylsulfate reductase subunit B|nr:4Fe-4S binding protein [Deltaproteobacteria bacterium]
MSILIELDKCVGCGNCVEICPGNILELVNKKVINPRPADCWGCAACLKSCPQVALSLYLPPAMGGYGGRLDCNYQNGRLLWVYTSFGGDILVIDGSGNLDSY